MKLNKKGFTLVELLAVIVVLAIIALIGYTAVGDVIEETRQGSAESTASNFESAAKTYCNVEMMKDNGTMPGSVTNVDVIDFDDNGSTVEVTNVTFSNSCQDVTITGLIINGYTCTKPGDSWDCTKTTS